MRPAHRLLSFLGDFRNGSNVIEQWQFGIRLAPQAALGEALDDLVDRAYAAFVANLNPLLKESGFFLGVQGAEVDADGTWATNPDGSYKKHEKMVTIQGADGAAPNLPRQTALALSLVTARPGPTGKGRVFFPLPQASLEADGRITAAHQGAFCSGFAEFIGDINAGGLNSVVVASSKGHLSAVTSVKVGRVVDTMRSRRRDQPEAYSVCAVPNNPL